MRKNILIRSAIILLIAVFFSAGFYGGAYAKYIASVDLQGTQIAGFGTVTLQEHKAKPLGNGKYELDEDIIVSTNKYENVIPGVDINKDPYIILTGTFEVSFALYVKIVEDNCINMISYKLAEGWNKIEALSDPDKGVYVYRYNSENGKEIPVFSEGDNLKEKKITVLKDDKIRVKGEYYINNGQFSLTFSAWVEQID